METELCFDNYWIMLRNGKPQGMDSSSGGYPYTAATPSSIHYSSEEGIKNWALVMNGHKETGEYKAVKVTIKLSWEN